MGFIEHLGGGPSHIDDQPPEYQEPGPSTSNLVASYPVKDGPTTEFACLSINAMDRIRMCNFSEQEVSAVHDVARRVWPKGVDKVKSLGNAREIKLKGYPWHPVPTGNDDSRRLLLGILSTLYSMGWIIHVSMSFSHYATTDKGRGVQAGHREAYAPWLTTDGRYFVLSKTPGATAVSSL
jgi:hypothetical protein